MNHATSLTEQALENLVNQFARPLDFLRELVQNSIDAGTPRIDVWVDWSPPTGTSDGVLQIGVDDHGCGMDERTIDQQLLQLYSSTKEDDLTKIGKFGIGFTSIYAIRPDRVWVQTGREGEHWDLLSGPDRTWEKVRRTEPVAGTKITLFKHMAPDAVDAFVTEARAVLQYWCEHSDVPITFMDRRQLERVVVDADDPFAAFADDVPAGPDMVQRPLDLDADLVERHQEPGNVVVVGLSDHPRYGFYNGGLTLLNTTNEDALGTFRDTLRHVSFKVKNDRLEHTLTRDNVLQDEAWRDALTTVVRVHRRLQERLLDEAEARATASGDVERHHRLLARECAADPTLVKRLWTRTLFVDVMGGGLTAEQVHAQEARVGAVLVGKGVGPLHEALLALGIRVVVDTPATRELLRRTQPEPLFEMFRKERELRTADALFCLPRVVEEATLPPQEQALLARTRELLGAAVGLRVTAPVVGELLTWAPEADSRANRLSLKVGEFETEQDTLCLDGPRDGRVFMRPGPRWFRLPGFLVWRTLLVDRRHPLFRTHVLASLDDLELAAVGLAQALLHTEGVEGEASYRRLLAAADMEVA